MRIQFKDVTSGVFTNIPRNELVIRVQPNESVYIKMNSKLPGLSMQTVMTELDLTYRRRFSDLKIPEAYESLILDAFKGDHSNFVRDDELDASWRIFTPLLHYLDDNKEIEPMEYPYGASSFPQDGQTTALADMVRRLARTRRPRRLHRQLRLQVCRRRRLPVAGTRPRQQRPQRQVVSRCRRDRVGTGLLVGMIAIHVLPSYRFPNGKNLISTPPR